MRRKVRDDCGPYVGEKKRGKMLRARPAFPKYHRPRWPNGPWPDAAQLLLLEACLADDARALRAWRTWRSLFALENIDHGAERLLPLLFHRLSRADLDASDRDLLAGSARRQHARHDEQMQCLSRVLKMFTKAGIETLLLKGAALNLGIYPPGTRPMADLDVVVPRPLALQAMQVLRQAGWQSAAANPERLIDAAHGCQFELSDSEHLDLHWDFFHGRRLADADQQALWQASTLVEVSGAVARILSTTHQLLHTCVHGARWCATPPLRWLVDACLIVRACNAQIDWDTLVALARRDELALYVWPTLAFLHEHFDAPIPATTIHRLRQAHTSVSGRLQHFFAAHRIPGVHAFWTSLPLHLVGYWRQLRSDPRVRLGEYLQLQHQFERPLHNYTSSLIRLQKAAIRESLSLGLRKVWRRLTGAVGEQIVCLGSVARWRTQGFHETQRWRGRLFRWSKANASVLFPDWPRADCRVVVVMAGLGDWRQIGERLSILFNGRTIPNRDITFDHKEIHCAIGADLLVAGRQQKLTFRCRPLLLGDGDARRLGVPIRMIRISRQKRKGEPMHGGERLPLRSDVPGTAHLGDGDRREPRRVA